METPAKQFSLVAFDELFNQGFVNYITRVAKAPMV
jgi:hypothetical protein